MRVICLNTGKITVSSFGDNVDGPIPVLGNYYTVVNQISKWDDVFYELAEFPRSADAINWFSSKMFAIPSDIDETELVNQREKEGVI